MTTAVKVAQDIYQITLPTPFLIGPVNVYLICEKDRVTLVDAGPNTDVAWDALVKGLESLSLSPSSIGQIILTHHHPDHTGLVGRFLHRPPVLGHPRCEPWLKRQPDFMKRYNEYFKKMAIKMGVQTNSLEALPTIEEHLVYAGCSELDTRIEEGAMLEGLEEWDVLYTPGHAFSHLVLYRSCDRVLIGGDVLLEHVSSNAILEPPYNDAEKAPRTLMDYRQTMRKLLEIDIEWVLPGHGQPFSHANRLLKERLEKQVERREQVLAMIGETSKTTFMLGQEMFSRVYRNQLDLVLSEIQGYLDWLIVRGEITSFQDKGMAHYQRVKIGG